MAAEKSLQWSRPQAIVLKGNMAQQYRRPAAALPLAYQARFRQIDELTSRPSSTALNASLPAVLHGKGRRRHDTPG